MSYDLVSHYVTLPAVAPAAARNANHTGPTCDALNIEGQATLTLVGVAAATAVVSMEESHDGTTWTAIAVPAASAGIARQLNISIPVTAGLSVWEANFQRTMRYVRVVITGSNHNLAATIKGKAKYLGN